MTDRGVLRGRARSVRSKMRKIGSMMQGSVIFRQMKCGKANCRCTKGMPHRFLCVTYKEGGKTKTVYVDKSLQGEALILARNYKRYKQLLKELTRVHLEILKSR
ncbi:MAG: DUF6788 family protein [Candidatus Eisenbacteria bacterium]